jgi:hypothetical protein
VTARDLRYRLRKPVRYRIVGSEAVVVRQDTAEVMVLNEVGTRVLVLVTDGSSPAEIAARLSQEYEVSADEVAGDVDEYFSELLDAGVIERVS